MTRAASEAALLFQRTHQGSCVQTPWLHRNYSFTTFSLRTAASDGDALRCGRLAICRLPIHSGRSLTSATGGEPANSGSVAWRRVDGTGQSDVPTVASSLFRSPADHTSSPAGSARAGFFHACAERHVIGPALNFVCRVGLIRLSISRDPFQNLPPGSAAAEFFASGHWSDRPGDVQRARHQRRLTPDWMSANISTVSTALQSRLSETRKSVSLPTPFGRAGSSRAAMLASRLARWEQRRPVRRLLQ